MQGSRGGESDFISLWEELQSCTAQVHSQEHRKTWWHLCKPGHQAPLCRCQHVASILEDLLQEKMVDSTLAIMSSCTGAGTMKGRVGNKTDFQVTQVPSFAKLPRSPRISTSCPLPSLKAHCHSE